MSTFDQMIIDNRDLANRYFGDENFDDDPYLFTKLPTNNGRSLNTQPATTASNLLSNNHGLYGRRVFLESPSLGNRDDDDLYRYVPSRLSDHTTALPPTTTEGLIDSLDLELDALGIPNNSIGFRALPASRPPAPLTQMTNPPIQSRTTTNNVPRTDPRQDPLLGPLLAELDALTAQQARLPQPPPPAPPTLPVYRRNSVPYDGNITRPSATFSQPNQALTSNANRTVTDALLDAELYDSLDVRNSLPPPPQPIVPPPQQQPRQTLPSSAPNLNSTNHSEPARTLPPRSSNMNSTDIFMPSSYDSGPGSFLSHFGPDDQLFQQPILNSIGQNYMSNPRSGPPAQQPPQSQYEPRDTNYQNAYSNPPAPSQRSTYAPPQKPPVQPPMRPTSYDNMDPFSEYHDMYAPNQSRMPPPPPPPQQQQRPPASQQTYQRYPAGQQQFSDTSKPPTNRELFFTDHDDDQMDPISHRQPQQQQSTGASGATSHRNADSDQDSRRQAIWNELQRNNAKVQEKNAKKRESANRREQRMKGNYAAPWSSNGLQQSSAPAKTTANPPPPRPPAPPKTNYIEENIDMIKNKENFYHRYPAKKYENLYSKRKDLVGGGKSLEKKDSRDGSGDNRSDYDQSQSGHFPANNDDTDNYGDANKHRSSLPVTINLNPGESSQKGALPATVTIPLDSHVNRVGDKISVNIDLRLVDLQNLQKQQQQNAEVPDWSGLDPLDRHIRKLERSIDQGSILKSSRITKKKSSIECRWIDCSCQRRQQQTLPPTHSPTQRSPPLPNPTINPSMGRYGKMTTGAGQGGYTPPTYSGNYYGYADKSREEDSYLAKMNSFKAGPKFKPYTGKDYEQFKKNYGVGGGHLGFDFDNPTYKEKTDKLLKTKEYAQQVEARNKQRLAEAPRRTLSDTRIPNESSKTQRALDYARVSTRHKPSSDASNRSSPPNMNDNAAPTVAPRRPTEVLHRPPPVQKPAIKSNSNTNNDLVERLAARHEQDKAQVQGILNPSQKRREPLFQDDRGASDIEKLAQERANQRRISPARPMPPSGAAANTNGRRPLRFDHAPPMDEPSYQPSTTHQGGASQHPTSGSHAQPPPAQQSPRRRERMSPRGHRGSTHDEATLDELANRHNDERMLMEAIRQELSERPLADDEELIVVEQ